MRTVTVVVRSKDRIGLVSEIARVIMLMDLPIIESNARTYMNRRTSKPESEFRAVLGIENAAQDSVLQARLRKLKGCLEASVKESSRIAA